MKLPRKIVSGGQTGVDQAALDWAITNRIPHGGWCPAGRKAENGRIPARFKLVATRSPTYAVRTRWNVRDTDGTVIFSMRRRLVAGSKRTALAAAQYGKPLLQLGSWHEAVEAARRLARFVQRHQIAVLNVAGPRASEAPGMSGFVAAVLTRAFQRGRISK